MMAPALCTRRWRSLSDVAVVAAVGIALAISTGLQSGDTHKPTRILSINLCADELVLRLAEIKNVVSVSYLTLGRDSNVIDLARQIPGWSERE
jgi:iron complex transport system substrate-binding protein